jgi:EH domain-containing protein 1
MTVLMCFQINEFVKRARAAKIHSYIMGHLKKEMPAMMGKQKAQQRLIDNLEDEFAKVLLQFDMLLSSWMLLL